MKKAFTIISVILIQTIGLAQKNFIDQNYITVTGKAEMHIAPDEIYIIILINEDDKKGKVSVENQEAKLLSELKSLGIDTDKAIKIKKMNNNYQESFLKKDAVVKVKEFELLVNNTIQLQKVFSLLETLEISSAHISKVGHSKIEGFKKEVKINAIKAAKEKANYLTSAINQTIGNAILIEELNNNTNSFNAYELSNVQVTGYAARTTNQYEFENIVLTESIRIYFQLK